MEAEVEYLMARYQVDPRAFWEMPSSRRMRLYKNLVERDAREANNGRRTTRAI